MRAFHVAATILLAALLAAAGAHAQTTGYTWLVDRQTYVIDADGQRTVTAEAERKAHDAQAAREVALYTDTRTRSLVFPNVEAGDVIRFAYRVTTFDPSWPGFSQTNAWRAQARTKQSERIYELAADLPLAVEQHGGDYRTERVADRVRHIFSWRNDKSVAAEAGSTSSADWGPRFSVSTFKSYAEIGDHYAKLHAGASTVTPDIAALAAEIVGTTTDREQQARLLFEWVTRNIRYVAVLVGQGRLTPTSASETIANRYGDCKAVVALLAALLASRDIASEPALVDINVARYTLPEAPKADFNHVFLYVPEFDRYLEPTSQFAAFGTLPWGHYDKPVIHAVAGKSRRARVPHERAEHNVAETHTIATIGSDGRISGTTREKASGAAATDLKSFAMGADETKAKSQLRYFGTPGTGKWTKRAKDMSTPDVELSAEFTLTDDIDLGSGEALTPPAGLRFLVRPGAFLVGSHDTARVYPFPCHAGRQVETIEVIVPAGFRPVRLPADRSWKTSIAEYRSTYALRDDRFYVRREFVTHPEGQVCTPVQSRELVELMSNIRRDQRSVVVFDRSP